MVCHCQIVDTSIIGVILFLIPYLLLLQGSEKSHIGKLILRIHEQRYLYCLTIAISSLKIPSAGISHRSYHSYPNSSFRVSCSTALRSSGLMIVCIEARLSVPTRLLQPCQVYQQTCFTVTKFIFIPSSST